MDVAALLRAKGSDVVTISPDASVNDVVAALAEYNIGAIVVSAGDGSVDGIVSERDVVRAVGREGTAALDGPVSAIATTTVTTCDPSDTVDELMSMMTAGRFRHVPVVVDGRLAGVISIGDVVKKRVAELELANQQLESYITGLPT